jgi:hypothetical protein
LAVAKSDRQKGEYVLIIEDKGQKEGLHILKNRYFKSHDIEVLRAPLPVGDYIIATDKVMDVIKRKTARKMELKKMDFLGTYDVSVDTKKDMQEIAGNICGKAHPRFRDECILAQNNGIKLYVLIENTDKVYSVNDVFTWHNPRVDRYNNIAYMHTLGKLLNVPHEWVSFRIAPRCCNHQNGQRFISTSNPFSAI